MMDRVNRRIDMQTCRDQHEAIRSLLNVFPEDEAFEPKAAADVVARLGRVLHRHLKLEDEILYPALLASEDRTLRDTAIRYREEMGGLSSEFTTLAGRWSSSEAVENRPEEFLAEWRAFKRRLEVRMAKEDHGLYAIADDYMRRDSSP